MNSSQNTAKELVRRLLGGERGDLPMHLALLLEKSSPLRNSDEHYRKILPVEIADLELTADTVKEITSELTAAISQNPDAALIAAVSCTGSSKVTVQVTKILIDPPRPLTVSESAQALGIAWAFLPACLKRDPLFLSAVERTRLVELLKALAQSKVTTIKQHSAELLKSLTAMTL